MSDEDVPGIRGDTYHPRGTDFCQADLVDSTVTYLRCPSCGSDDVSCESTTQAHTHRCFTCEHATISAPRRQA